MASIGCCDKYLGAAMHYETLKTVDIRNKKVGTMYRTIQLTILVYVIGFAIIYKKGYQEIDSAISTVSIKLKGTAFVNFKNFSPLFNGIQVYDPSDYVIPPRERNGLFVMTNMIITPNQTQGKCPEDADLEENRCSHDRDCLPRFRVVSRGNGVRTGACVRSDRNAEVNVCEIYGWCPVENDTLPMPGLDFSETVPLLEYAKHFTVLVKNSVNFPKFRVKRRNILGYKSRNMLKHCTYNMENNKHCPIFKLGDIIKYCGDNFTDVAYNGGSYGIIIDWDCDLDHSVDYCIPSYDFARLDDPDAPISPGYNFRFSNYFVVHNKRYRTLTKAFGLKFHVIVNAKAGRFSTVPLFLHLGAGFALLGIAKLCCDFMMIHCLEKRNVYRHYKVDCIEDSEDSAEEQKEKNGENEKHGVI